MPIFLYFAVIFIAFMAIVNGQCPNGIVQRKEFRDLTASEWAEYKDAVVRLSKTSKWGEFTSTHLGYTREAHNNPQFFPWHRVFLRNYEIELQKINPSVVIPYWDWSYDSQNPLGSGIFDSSYFGIQLGGDPNWPMTVPDAHNLLRDYDPDDFGTFYDTASISAMSNRHSSYDSFHRAIEGAPHGSVHVAIGGNDGDMSMMQSPNDPLFWLHHAYIDKIWADRQALDPSYLRQYDGTKNGRPVKDTDILQPFNVPVSSTFITTDFCYTYSPFSARMSPDGLEIVIPHEEGTPVKTPKPLPDMWIQMNGMDEQYIRSMEMELAGHMINNTASASTTTSTSTTTSGSTSPTQAVAIPAADSKMSTIPGAAERLAQISMRAIVGIIIAQIFILLLL